MKRRNLLKLFYDQGWTLVGHGGNHDIISKDGKNEYIPRHREINEMLAKALIKKHNLDGGNK